MRRRSPAVLAAAATVLGGLLVAAASPASGAPPSFTHLRPGAPAQLVERLPVNVVLLGYEQVNPDDVQRQLPATSKPVVRSRANYGIKEEVGITFRYEYDVRRTARAYEDRFFAELKRLSTPGKLTDFQQAYNAQENNSRVITDNHFIDAPSVEKWLADNPPAGVDTRRNTVFLINWNNRADFEHHVYTKFGEPDPDTGYSFAQRASRKMVAWGGTTADDEETGLGSTRRVWFFDGSAGPEAFAGSFNVDDLDLDGDDVPDYRIPPVWEYGDDRYRSGAALPGDLAKLVRYVALDLLFTPSPLYPVDLPTEDGELAKSINLDGNFYEGVKGVDASGELVDQPLLLQELGQLLPRKRLSYDSQDLPFAGDARRCYLAFLDDESCYPKLGYPSFANFFLQNTFQLERTKDDTGRVDYELPIFNYSVALDVPALGFADDDYRTGEQSYVFNFWSPAIQDAGYGLTTTNIHEVGHHVGLSHPHDGYDSASGVDFSPTGEYYFAWLGDYSNTMMSYIDLNWDFSQFDLDSMDRFQAAEQVEAANRLTASALGGRTPAQGYDELRSADRAVGEAKAALARHDYRAANAAAERAYDLARAAADAAAAAPALQAAVPAPGSQPAAEAAEPVHSGNEFIDSLGPNSPRSLP